MVTTAPVTIEQAAALLGVSATTIRRRIRAGTLQVTETKRPQGTVWLVHLPPGTAPAAETATVDTAGVATGPSTSEGVAAPAEAMVSLIQTTIGTVLGPLVGQVDALRQANERQADELKEMARENGELRAENRALLASTATAAPDPTPRPLWSSWPRGWIAGATTVLAIVAVVVLLASR